MAMKELFSVLTTTYPVSADASWRQGAVLLLDATTGQVTTANRLGTAAQNGLFVGFSADNTAKVATEIFPAPAGSNYVSGTVFLKNNNAFFVGLKRNVMLTVAGETLTNPTNFTDVTASGNASPKRGCSVFHHGGNFVTDMLAWDSSGRAVETTAASTDDYSSTMYAVGDLLTWSAGSVAGTTGRLVRIQADDFTTCRAVARIDDIALGSVKSNGVDNTTLAYITAL